MTNRQITERDRGSVSIIMLALTGLAVGMIVFGVLAAALAVGRANAQTAADLGAIAAADHYEQQRVSYTDDPDAACARGHDVVKRNGGQLVSCEIQADRSVIIGVQVRLTVDFMRVHGVARAGPIDH